MHEDKKTKNETQYQRLKKECFWEYHFSSDEIKALIHSDDIQEKKFVFEKILLNSSELLKDMTLFNSQDLKELLENYVVPRFNDKYVHRRKNIIECYFFDKPLEVEELKWIA